MKQKWKHRWHRLEQLEQRCHPRGLILLALALALLVVGYAVGFLQQLELRSQLERSAQRHAVEEIQRLDLEKELSAKALEVQMEQQSQQEMRALMARQRQELIDTKTELTFYRNIMAPEKNADGVSIHDFLLDDTVAPDHYRYRLVLTQQKVRKRFVKGHVTLLLAGSQDGKPVEKALTEFGIDEKSLAFSFRYFQQLEGEFTLPGDFVPDRFVVKVSLPKRKGQKSASSETTYGFSELLQEHLPVSPEGDKA